MARHLRSRLACAALMLLAAGCKGPELLGPQVTIADMISRVSTDDGAVEASLFAGAAPAAGSDAAPTVPANATAVNGGSVAMSVEQVADFATVIVSIDGIDGYYQLTLPSSATLTDLVLGISPDANSSTMQVRIATGTGGALSQYALQALRVIRVGTGDVQVSISWTGASDVDLHVTDPDGEEVYFGNLESASGGTLDLDSNAGCQIDGVNNENIVWPTGSAPRGAYVVVVDYWSDCGAPRSDYVVTVAIAGQAPQVISGSFVGSSTGQPSVEIGTFSY